MPPMGFFSHYQTVMKVLLDLDQHIGHKLEKQDGILQETNLQQLNMCLYSL